MFLICLVKVLNAICAFIFALNIDKLIIDKKVAMCATKAKIYQRLSNLGKNLIVGNFLYP